SSAPPTEEPPVSIRLRRVPAVAALLLTFSAAVGAEPSSSPDAQALARKIDQLIAKRWADAKVEPAPLAEDAEFLRRVYLDLAGRIPSVAEARAFLQDRRPDKRTRLVDPLPGSPRYTAHFTDTWP